jgi:hypothetical protein
LLGTVLPITLMKVAHIFSFQPSYIPSYTKSIVKYTKNCELRQWDHILTFQVIRKASSSIQRIVSWDSEITFLHSKLYEKHRQVYKELWVETVRSPSCIPSYTKRIVKYTKNCELRQWDHILTFQVIRKESSSIQRLVRWDSEITQPALTKHSACFSCEAGRASGILWTWGHVPNGLSLVPFTLFAPRACSERTIGTAVAVFRLPHCWAV